MQTTVAAHATTAIILSTIITTSHHHISASYIVTDRLSPGDAACPGTSYNIYNCEWIKIYTSGVFFVISVMTDVYVIASRRTVRLRSAILHVIGSLSNVEGSVIKQDECRTVRLCSPVLPIGSLKWQRSFKPQRHRIPEPVEGPVISKIDAGYFDCAVAEFIEVQQSCVHAQRNPAS